MPALASSAARIPPAAPTPTITTSAFSVAIVPSPSAFGLRLKPHNGGPVGLAALQVLGREQRLRSGEADEAPSGEIPVPTIDRISEHPLHGVRTQRDEKGLSGWPSERRRLALLERGDHLVLAPFVELRKRHAVGGPAMSVELRKAAAIEVLLVRIGPGKGEVDVVEHVGVPCARLARGSRHDARWGSRARGSFVVVEEGAVPGHVAVGRGARAGRRRGDRRVLVMAFGTRIGGEPGARHSSRRDTHQEGATSFIMLAHASSLARLIASVLMT